MTPGHLDIVTLNTDENGVTTEDRLHLNNDLGCLHIKEWSPLSPPPEDLWQSSPFSDGRVLAMRKYGNAADEFVLKKVSRTAGRLLEEGFREALLKI